MIARALIAACALASIATPAWAAPPFTTDDPGVLEPGKAEVIPYLDAVLAKGEDTGEAGIDASVGIAPGVQAGLIVPLHSFEGGNNNFSLGDVTVSLKAELAQGSQNGLAVAIGPALALPTDATGRARAGLDLPVWAGLGRGEWSITGGGGLRLDAKADGGSRAFGGLVAHRTLGEGFGLGAEAYAESGNGEAPTLAMMGLGLDWALSPRAALVAAGHAMLANRSAHGRFHFHTAIVITP